MALLRCHGDSDYNKTQIIRNFHLYIIQLILNGTFTNLGKGNQPL